MRVREPILYGCVNINSFCVYRFGHLLHLKAFSFNEDFDVPLGELEPGLGYSTLNRSLVKL